MCTHRCELPCRLNGKESACQCRSCEFDPRVSKICEEGNGNPLQYPCLGNPIERGGCKRAGHTLATKQKQRYPKLLMRLIL